MLEEEDPKTSLRTTIVLDSRDWGALSRDAWIYGIVIGWDRESLDELQERFQWSTETRARLIRLHRAFLQMKAP